ncbi:hypothetical protein LTR86_010611 [Recurvomyces mirabilis]|nr:hypothetical protein LTR86_010611 [Recurvomyces mirabilis]
MNATDKTLGGDPAEGVSSGTQLNAASLAAIKAVILMGDPRYVYGLPYEVGTCRAGGVSDPDRSFSEKIPLTPSQFDARSSSFQCAGGSKIQSYCDSADPYCCNGNDANVHQGYGSEYGQAALTFIKGKLSSGGSTTTPTTSAGSTPKSTTTAKSTTSSAASSPTGGSGSCSALYGQCGGQGWQGPTCCSSGTCKASNAYYSQCL